MLTTIVMVKYHSIRMLLTMDLQNVFRQVVEEYGEAVVVTFEPMNDTERQACEMRRAEITEIKVRFFLLVSCDGMKWSRQPDLERRIIAFGQK